MYINNFYLAAYKSVLGGNKCISHLYILISLIQSKQYYADEQHAY
jgi:hypothetical protein